VITGVPEQGVTLSTSTGAWTNTPVSYAYQWSRCASGSCTFILGATSAGYTAVSADIGNALQVAVTATNSGGATTASAVPTAVVQAASPSPSPSPSPPPSSRPPAAPTVAAPLNAGRPEIGGTPEAGQTLSASAGTWTNTPTTYGYQWLRCASANCSPITGATAPTYTTAGLDIGQTLEVTVTATNSGGSTGATSAPTPIVQAAPTLIPALAISARVDSPVAAGQKGIAISLATSENAVATLFLSTQVGKRLARASARSTKVTTRVTVRLPPKLKPGAYVIQIYARSATATAQQRIPIRVVAHKPRGKAKSA
jgi:hypothetical protein